MKDFVLPLAFTVLIVVGVGGMIRAVFAVYLHRKRIRDYYAAVDHDLRLVVDLLEVEAGINQAHVVYTPEQCVELANRLRWILVREREKENRQNEKR